MRTLHLGILAHVDAGKTSLTERLLFDAGAIKKLGSVDAGNTQTDSLDLERQRGITIKAAVVSFSIGNTIVNLVDTPGHPDFIAEVERTLGILDAAVVVVSAVEGVQAQTRVLVRALRRLRVPFVFFVNKVDRLGADYARVIASLAEQLQLRALAMSAISNAGSKTMMVTARDFATEPSRQVLVDLLVENDDDLLDDFVLAPQGLTEQRVRHALVEQVRKGVIHPAFAGSAATGAGVDALMSAIETMLPGRQPDSTGPVQGHIFKIDRGWGGEKQAYLTLTSGTIQVRDLLDLPKGQERVTSIHVFDAGRLVPTGILGAGQVGRISGLAGAVIGDIVGPNSAFERRAYFAAPTLETQVLARRPSDRQALWIALGQLAEQDPLINLRHNEDAGEIFVSLYGEVQKEVIGSTLEQDFGLAVDFLESTVICAERLVGVGEALDVLFESDNPFFATIGLRAEPRPPGAGNTFTFAVNSGLMPAGFYRAVEETVAETLKQGRFGWPVIDCQFTMTAAGQAAPESTAADFRQLTPLVVAAALSAAETFVCEPVSRFRIDAPPETIGSLLTLLGQAGATLAGTVVESRAARLEGTIATASLQRLQRQLPDVTSGAGTMESAFDHYAPMGSPNGRLRTGFNPFDRSNYLAKWRRSPA
ncbi:TetM/TetW/TetO/TetS family tetracycline resistance ribosomal protection protein [Devosia sp.]|uniref:elongation factor G n=1 Tax=Devosia sp. TaxID=1871048 RepID=UPI001B2AB2C1|nr:TetM/TetW/TetO/TetS family tetracycline resistance ribosomal protection protein [Devosia sp.]MBO9588535.1 TetM/TetW/TetO/TetS family tetracycline resistance ribosomal protection protein [Devosia sp.]